MSWKRLGDGNDVIWIGDDEDEKKENAPEDIVETEQQQVEEGTDIENSIEDESQIENEPS